MKRILFGVLMGLLVSVGSFAARALSEPFIAVQPDGTQLVVTLYGDEHISWLTTSDDVLVVEKNKAYYVAAIDAEGVVRASTLLAHPADKRSAQELQLCRQQKERRSLFNDNVSRTLQKARRAQVTSTSYFPHKGSPKCLVILVNFSDNSFASDDPKAQFEQYFNAETQVNLGHNEQKNLVSVREYFNQCSHGKFTPDFTVIGPYTLPKTLEYYGEEYSSDNHDKNFNQFCKDAIAAADADVNFKDFDNTGDNKAELVCVIYAGYGQSVSGNPANTLWPKCSPQGISTNDGVTVTYMNCSPELYRLSNGTNINGIGLFCHEYSHGMGLPDQYPYNTSARINNQTPEFWDLMDYGEYAHGGYAPVPYTAWEQETMGWIEIEQLTESQNVTGMTSLMKEGGKAYKFGNGANSEEWMILENVQPYDADNRILGFPNGGGYSKGHGLLVWHVAYSGSTVNMSDHPNDTAGEPRVCIVPADGLVINGYQFGSDKPYTQNQYIASLTTDPFGGTGPVDHLDASMELPNFYYYNCSDGTTGKEAPKQSLTNITESDGAISFTFNDGETTSISEKGKVKSEKFAPATEYFDLQGRRIANGQKPTAKGLYIMNGRKVAIK